MKADRQLLKVPHDVQVCMLMAAQGETWVCVESKDLNLKANFLFDTELFVTEVLQSVLDINELEDKSTIPLAPFTPVLLRLLPQARTLHCCGRASHRSMP
jgi:hypothetical protein